MISSGIHGRRRSGDGGGQLHRPSVLRVAVGLLLTGLLVASGCGGDSEDGPVSRPGGKAATKTGKAGKAPTRAGAAPAAKATGKAGKAAGRRTWTDEELEEIADYEVKPDPPMPDEYFVEGVDNRDPFRPQKEVDIDKTKEIRTDDCVLSSYALDELRLIGIISGIPAPRAIFVDPRGTDWKVARGDCIGKSGGRITRIRADAVTLIEVNLLTGEEIERKLELYPGRLDVGAALKSGDPMALTGPKKTPALPAEGVPGLGVVPGAAAGRPPLAVGMSKPSFEAAYGSCFVRKPSLSLIGGARGEVWQRTSTVGECADLPGSLVIITDGVVSSVQTL